MAVAARTHGRMARNRVHRLIKPGGHTSSKARFRQLRRPAGRQIRLLADAARQVLRRVSLMGPRMEAIR